MQSISNRTYAYQVMFSYFFFLRLFELNWLGMDRNLTTLYLYSSRSHTYVSPHVKVTLLTFPLTLHLKLPFSTKCQEEKKHIWKISLLIVIWYTHPVACMPTNGNQRECANKINRIVSRVNQDYGNFVSHFVSNDCILGWIICFAIASDRKRLFSFRLYRFVNGSRYELTTPGFHSLHLNQKPHLLFR